MWEAISANRSKSIVLIVLMGMLLALLGAVIGGVFFAGEDGMLAGGAILGVMIAGFIWFVMTLVALFQGRNILLSISGAREVSHSDAPQLYNIVEEMSIAAALPKPPKVYIMEDKAPNAFAVGTPENAAVAITTGLLSVLSRDELQGVMAHEIGHIKNLDTKFMTIAGVMMGTIVILADVFMRGLIFGGGGRRRSSSSDKGGGQLQLILFLIALVFAILAPLFAQLLYLACSRSREYLADASAAVFTRYPEGLASALEKISANHSKLASANRVTAPMYIVNPIMKAHAGGNSLFSTHPPTNERIKVLRSMGGGAGLKDYNEAFTKICGKAIIGETTLRSAEVLKMRGITTPEPPQLPKNDIKRQTREATDILHRLNHFAFISCPCGVRLKIPPQFNKPICKCPRCGKEHPVKIA
ncbi:MAG: M48 family metallopeptidase [Victivallales bacterium]|nr:M48 family metallopeptidase [Victivallales bacterium]